MTARAIAMIALGLFVAFLIVGFIRDPFGWRKAKVERLEGAKVQAEQKAAIATEAVRIIERHSTETRIIQEQVEREVDVAQSLPGADTPLDPARRAALCTSLSRLRNAPACNDNTPG